MIPTTFEEHFAPVAAYWGILGKDATGAHYTVGRGTPCIFTTDEYGQADRLCPVDNATVGYASGAIARAIDPVFVMSTTAQVDGRDGRIAYIDGRQSPVISTSGYETGYSGSESGDVFMQNNGNLASSDGNSRGRRVGRYVERQKSGCISFEFSPADS